ncbi:MAG: hypothetical protein NVS2B12_11610 [Ktedonobacteraceae bacterium]
MDNMDITVITSEVHAVSSALALKVHAVPGRKGNSVLVSEAHAVPGHKNNLALALEAHAVIMVPTLEVHVEGSALALEAHAAPGHADAGSLVLASEVHGAPGRRVGLKLLLSSRSCAARRVKSSASSSSRPAKLWVALKASHN